MRNSTMGACMAVVFLAATAVPVPVFADGTGAVRMVEMAPNPYGTPRPSRDADHVPLRTSLYFELAAPAGPAGNRIRPDTLDVRLEPGDGSEAVSLIAGGTFAPGMAGHIRALSRPLHGHDVLSVYIEPGRPLRPATAYTVRISAASEQGSPFADGPPLYRPAALSFAAAGGRRQPAGPAQWRFTTEADPAARPVVFSLDLDSPPLRWHGAFFSGFCNVQFGTQEALFGPTYDLMDDVRREYPRAWSLQRDFWLTGTEHRRNSIFSATLPNIVREKETRRIVAMEETTEGVRLRVEDVFGHAQYGIPADRPLSADYRPGYTVLIADGVHHARTEVLAADDAARTVLVRAFPDPPGGWHIDLQAPVPTREDPDLPGLFAPGGTYLRRFDPHGTAVYFWGRLEKEWDLAVGRYGRRVLPNFTDAPGCLSAQGRAGVAPKDYRQWHEVARVITGHIIDRYGEQALDFVWSVFNEPDLSRFWNANGDERLRYYDYTTDAILRAFEDRGYDSDRVLIGGLELGAIFGANLKLRDFLLHCSPRASASGELRVNAAYADPRLDGQRSRRVERLCSAHEGRGSPCDFVSIHLYDRSEMSARKLEVAKRMALDIDEAFFRDLRIHSHEACPGWSPLPDPAFADSYRGNGYFKSWSMDLVARQLRGAADDPRFAFGETILTAWPPAQGLSGLNTLTRMLRVDDRGGGRPDRTVTVPNPIFHALTLLSAFGDRYWVLPPAEEAGHTVSGFASREEDGTVRVLLVAHHEEDVQSRSDVAFDITLQLRGLGWTGPAQVTEYRFDRSHNSYFEIARTLLGGETGPPAEAEEWHALVDRIQQARGKEFEEARHALRRFARDHLAALHPGAEAFVDQTPADELRAVVAEMRDTLFSADHGAGRVFAAAEIEPILDQARLRPTAVYTKARDGDAAIELTPGLAGNGLNILRIRPAP